MRIELPPAALDRLFRTARTHHHWSDKAVDEPVIREIYDLLKWGPTSANCSPSRFVWVRSPEGRSRLSALAMEANRAQISEAPLGVIVGTEMNFPQTLPKLLPSKGEMMRQMFLQHPEIIEVTATRNGTLQGAYLIMAARALGLDCGALSGFDNAAVDKEFFAGTTIKSNFICLLGYGKPELLTPRSPRLSFEEAGRFA